MPFDVLVHGFCETRHLKWLLINANVTTEKCVIMIRISMDTDRIVESTRYSAAENAPRALRTASVAVLPTPGQNDELWNKTLSHIS